MPEAGPVKVAILVGIIKPVLLRVQQYFERRIAIRAIPMAKNSGSSAESVGRIEVFLKEVWVG